MSPSGRAPVCKCKALIKHYIPVAHHTLQTSFSFTQPQSPRVHLNCFLFYVITYHLVLGLSASLPLKFGIPYLFTLGNHNHSPHSDGISLKTHYFQLAYPAT